MFINLLWYLAVILSVWGSSLGGVTLPGLGLIYPFRAILPILAVILLFTSKRKDWGVNKGTWLTVLPLSLFMLLHGALSLLWSSNQLNTVKAVVNLAYILLFALVFYRMVMNDKRIFHNTLLVLSLNIIILMLLGVFECFSGIRLLNTKYLDVVNNLGLHFPSVCFENTNNFAFNIILFTPIIMFVLDEVLKLDIWKKWLIKISIILLSAFVLLNTGSRLSFITYPVVLFVYLVVRMKGKTLKMILVYASAAALVAIGIFATGKLIGTSDTPSPSTGVKVSASDTLRKSIVNIKDRSTRVRAIMLVKALYVTRDTYGLGKGAKNSAQLVKSYTSMPSITVTDYHFFYAELIAEYGVIPFAFFIVFQLLSIIVSLKLYRRSPDNRNLAACSIAGSIGFVIASAFCSSAMFVYGMWIQFLLWSYVMVQYHKLKEK